MKLDLTIFIPTYNRPEMLETCILSVRRSLEGRDISYEIFVVNESPRDVVLNYDNVNVLNYGKEIMPCEAMYRALRISSGRYFIRIDDDNEINTNLIINLYSYIIKNKNVAFCGALGRREDCSISNPGTKLSKFLKRTLRSNKIGNKDYEVDLVDNVYIMNPSLIDFDKFHLSCKFFPWSFEDGYDQIRLKKLNYKVVIIPYAETIHHTHSGSLNVKQVYHYARSRYLMYRCIFKFSYVKTITLSVSGLLFIPYIYRKDRTNIKLLIRACRLYLKGTKDAIVFFKNNKWLD